MNPQPLEHEANVLTITLSLQVRLKDVKVCAQQSMSNHLQGGSLEQNFTNMEKKTIMTKFVSIDVNLNANGIYSNIT